MTHAEAQSLVIRALHRAGFNPNEITASVAEVMDAEWRGRKSHGLAIVPELVEWSAGKRHEPVVIECPGATAFIKGGDGPGPLVAEVGMDAAIELATEYGIGCVGAENRCPFLIAGHQPRRAALNGFVAIAMSTAPSKVAPSGGTTAIFGTNPIAAAFPRTEGGPIVIDLSMTLMPASEVRRRGRLGERLPEGVALDSHGEPTTDPVAAQHGAMLPFGGHKGSVLALLVELLAGGLTGTRVGTSHQGERGMFFLAVRPDIFGRREEFLARTDAIVGDLQVAGASVRVPGIMEPDLTSPIEVPEPVVAALRALG